MNRKLTGDRMSSKNLKKGLWRLEAIRDPRMALYMGKGMKSVFNKECL